MRGAGAAGRGRGFASKKMVRVGDTLYAKTGNGPSAVPEKLDPNQISTSFTHPEKLDPNFH